MRLHRALKKIGQQGQTMVEYLLLIMVVMLILNSVFIKLNEYLLTNPDSFQNRYLGIYDRVFNTKSGDGWQYKRFYVRR